MTPTQTIGMGYEHRNEFTKVKGEMLWHRRGAIWRALARHPEGLTQIEVAKLIAPDADRHELTMTADRVSNDLRVMGGVKFVVVAEDTVKAFQMWKPIVYSSRQWVVKSNTAVEEPESVLE